MIDWLKVADKQDLGWSAVAGVNRQIPAWILRESGHHAIMAAAGRSLIRCAGPAVANGFPAPIGELGSSKTLRYLWLQHPDRMTDKAWEHFSVHKKTARKV